MAGLLQPSGGHKGIAMALSMGVLTSMLSGAAYGTGLATWSMGKAGGRRPFCRRDRYLCILRARDFQGACGCSGSSASRQPATTQRLLVPGEMETETEARYRKEGVPRNSGTTSDLLGWP